MYKKPKKTARGAVKVLQVATSGSSFDTLLLALVDRLEDEGYEVHIACADDPRARALAGQGYRVWPVHIETKIAPISNLRSLWRMYRLMRRQRFDVVHVHTPVASVVGRIAAKLAGVPAIICTADGFRFHDRMRRRVRLPIVWAERLLGHRYADDSER